MLSCQCNAECCVTYEGIRIANACGIPVVASVAGYVEVYSAFKVYSCLKVKSISAVMISYNIVACRPIARQRPRNKRLYNNYCYVIARQASMFPRQQFYCNI
jgi:hypothetical protein